MKARVAIRRNSMTSGGPGDEAAAGSEALRERSHPQVHVVLQAEQLAGTGATGAEHADPVRLVDHQPRAVAAAELDDRRQVADVALHREDAVDDDEHPAAVARRTVEHLLQLVHLVVPEWAKLGAGESAAVEDGSVVGRVADHRVPRPEDRADAAQVRLIAGAEDDRILGVHELGELALEIDVEGDRAVQKPRAREARPVGLQGIAGRLLDAFVAGESEVVVGAEHDRLAPLHLDDGTGLGLDHAEVGEEVVLLGQRELLDSLVGARLLEYVHGGPGWSGTCRRV